MIAEAVGFFLRAKVPAPLALGALLFLIAISVGQCAGRVKAEGDADRARAAQELAEANLGTCKTNLLSAQAAEQRQRDAVAQVRAESAALVERSEKAARAARAKADDLRKRADRVLAERPRTNDLCLEADRLLREVR